MSEENKHDWSLLEKIGYLQSDLKAPKKANSGVAFKSRSCEDILKHANPMFKELGLVLTMSEDIKNLGDRFYVICKVTLTDTKSKEAISNQTIAREGLPSKINDESQTSGKAISYARKYALGGLLAIDDTKDADTQANPNEGQNQAQNQPAKDQGWIDVLKRDLKEFSSMNPAIFSNDEIQNINNALVDAESTGNVAAWDWLHSQRLSGQDRMKESKEK